MKNKHYVVVGGGISGMLTSYVLKLNNPNAIVTLLERGSVLGGLLRSSDYGLNGRFDMGVHTMYETGIADLDNLLYGITPEGGWNKLSSHERDYGGAYFANKLHTNTAYIDLQSLPTEEHQRYITTFFQESTWGEVLPTSDFFQYFNSRYGHTITSEILAPIITKFTGVIADESHYLAGKIIPFERICLLNEQVVEHLMESASFRSRIAYPNQKKLPTKWIPNRNAYYPSQYGMYRYVDAFQKRLEDLGIKIILNANIKNINNNIITFVKHNSISYENLFWTTHPAGLAKNLGIEISDIPVDPSRTTVIANFWLNQEPNCESLYYAFSYDKEMHTHRFSCPHYFCPHSTINGQYRLTSELVISNSDINLNWENVALNELQKMGVTNKENATFKHAEIIPYGYPSLSKKNINAIVEMKNRIKFKNNSDILFLGMLSKDNLFFQTDLMQHAYETVNKNFN